MEYRQSVDASSSQPGDLVLAAPGLRADALAVERDLDAELAKFAELWRTAEVGSCGLSEDEFSEALAALGRRLNWGLPVEHLADSTQRASFCSGLKLAEFALAQGCALGRDAAWERFVALYRGRLTQAAIAIAGSATAGHELADSLYGELYGLQLTADGQRRSPLASYSGRGSLLGWLRTTLAQRHVDRHRKSWRETPIEDAGVAETLADSRSGGAAQDGAAELARLSGAVGAALSSIGAEDRVLLAAYYLDRRTINEIGRMLGVHEATISRRLKRVAAEVRTGLLAKLEATGLSRRAAEEALGADPRDVEINLRAVLQSSQTGAFQDKRAPGETGNGHGAMGGRT
jgi:RNA polymerase sigma-70 factor, ECF subfamily